MELPALLRSGFENGMTEGDNFAACGCVKDLDEGDDEGVDASEETEVAADGAAAPVADHIAKVSPGEEEEGDPEEKEDAPDGLAGAEADEPEEKGEDSPHEKCD